MGQLNLVRAIAFHTYFAKLRRMENEIVIPEEARQRYIERRKKDIESLRSALSTRTFDEFKRIGHQLKGNAASFGYSDLEKVAIQIEVAGQNQDAVEASRQLDLFQQWFARISPA